MSGRVSFSPWTGDTDWIETDSPLHSSISPLFSSVRTREETGCGRSSFRREGLGEGESGQGMTDRSSKRSVRLCFVLCFAPGEGTRKSSHRGEILLSVPRRGLRYLRLSRRPAPDCDRGGSSGASTSPVLYPYGTGSVT